MTKVVHVEGLVITADVSSVQRIDCDAIWQITRAGVRIKGTLWVPTLAPSPQLFTRYLREWKGKPGDQWWHMYEEAFKKELETGEKLKTPCDNDVVSCAIPD